MKVKELDLTANVAWSPAAQTPIFLASGTAAQQLDATFSTNSALEIHALNLAESGQQMPKITSFPVEHRYHKLIWGAAGMSEGGRPNGLLVGGLDQGILTMYDAHKLMQGQHQGSIVATKDKHTGPVQALDFNPFQANLLASGASDSEIYIWDVNKLTTPMTPGAKSQPPDDVRCVAWNKQVQHILATTFATRCVVWDLRKNDPIIKLSDATSRMRTKVVAWHPEVATQLCLASEDDHTPVIQIWDLRLASSPIRTLESHSRGILSVAWCQQDSDLLLSCGKDNRILCWNPNSNQPGGEVLCELASSNQWSFDVSWCPRNPAVVASSSFEGRVSIYSLMGGQEQTVPSTAIADSFPGMEAMQPMASQPTVAMQLKTPPKWLKRPCGASFGFGGRLVTFDTQKVPSSSQQQPPLRSQSSVFLSRVVTEQELVERSQKLETSIQNQNLPEFCDNKIAAAASTQDRQIWTFLKANFSENPRLEFLNLLGYNPEETAQKVELVSGVKAPSPCLANGSVDDLTTDLAYLNTTDDKETAFEAIAASSAKETDVQTQRKQAFKIVTDDGDVGVLSRALLTGNIELAVEICLEQNRTTDALILSASSPELLERTQKRYFSKCNSDESHLIESVVTGRWSDFAQECSVDNWKEALVAVITYAPNEDFPQICSTIGDRLVPRGGVGGDHGLAAMLCYICAGDLEKLVECWMGSRDTNSGPKALQDLVEVVMSLKSAVEQIFGEVTIASGALSAKLAQYAGILASQGALSAALAYLGNSDEESIASLRERLNGAIGRKPQQVAASAHSSRVTGRRRSSGHHSGSTSAQAPAPLQPQPTYQSQSHYDPRRSSVTPETSYPSMLNPVDHHPAAQRSHVPDQGGPGHMPPVSSGPGWNDPPPMALGKLRTQPKTVSAIPEPITQPLFGVPAAPSATGPPPLGQPSPYGMMNPGQPPMMQQHMGAGDPYGGYSSFAPQQQNPQSSWGYPGEQQQQPYSDPPANFMNSPGSNMMNPAANFMTPAASNVQQQPANFSPVSPQSRQPAQPRQPEPPKEKEPIPSEHRVLQEVFEGLRTKCLSAANHPQIRRKLDDVAKKLEILYDKLRDNELSEETTVGLHGIVRFVGAHDYASGLGVINELVSTGSFATLSEFLPGVKVLLQVAAQLGVYVTF